MPYEGGNKDGKHYWLTPPDLMAELQREFNFDFDACPYPRPYGFDGLTVDWGKSTYVNPPFQGPTAWVRKAIAEHQKGKDVVVAFPTDKWIHYFLRAGAEMRSLGDVRWHAIEDGTPGKGIGRFTMLFILKGKNMTDKEQRDLDMEMTKKGFERVNDSLVVLQKSVLRLGDEILAIKKKIEAQEK